MARILGLWFWISTAAVVALVASAILDLIFTSITILLGGEAAVGIDLPPRLLATALTGLLILPFFPAVRRRLWKLWWLRDVLPKVVFEDLDGEWGVEIESNWPTISRMLEASRNPECRPFDPLSSEKEDVPKPSVHNFRATIELGWDKAQVTFHPNENTPLKHSRTIVFELLRPCQDYPPRVFWGFRQFNSEVSATDEDNFLGAAMLDVISADELVGTYWNNRSWRSGLNAAGRITMKRLKSKTEQQLVPRQGDDVEA